MRDPAASAADTVGLSGPSLDLSRIANDSIARLLGVSASAGPRQLLDRLSTVFPAQMDSGSPVYAYRPVGTQPVDGPAGALVSGAQGALYQQATVIGASIGGLLDQMIPSITDPDDEDIASLVSAYRMNVDGVVREFGREGGAVLNVIRVRADALGTIRRELRIKLGFPGAEPAGDGTERDQPMFANQRELRLLDRDALIENLALLSSLTHQLTHALTDQYTQKVLHGVSARLVRLAWSVRALPASVAQVRAEFASLRLNEADLRVILTEPEREEPGEAHELEPAEAGILDAEQTLQWCEMAAGQWPQQLAAGRKLDIEVIESEADALYGALSHLQPHLKRLRGSGRLIVAMQELLRQLQMIIRVSALITGNKGHDLAGQTG